MVVHSDGGFTSVCWLISLLAVGLWFERIHGLLSKASLVLRNCNLVCRSLHFCFQNQFKMSDISEQPIADLGSVANNGFRDGSFLDEATSHYCECKDDKWVLTFLTSNLLPSPVFEYLVPFCTIFILWLIVIIVWPPQMWRFVIFRGRKEKELSSSLLGQSRDYIMTSPLEVTNICILLRLLFFFLNFDTIKGILSPLIDFNWK